MESIKAHLFSLLDEVTQTLELAKRVKANDKKEINKLLKLASSNNEYIDMDKLANEVDVLTDKIAKEEKEIYAMKKIAYRINKAIQFANGEEVED
jgi:hypothetical protein|nr:MAG TPA: hypothetical protein [Bacteriophage sp.]